MSTLRCLAISNSYPPDHAGGYELGACNILENLAQYCQWENRVLSSVRRSKSAKTDGLELTGFFPGKLGPEIELWRTKKSLLKKHASIVAQMQEKARQADLVFVFNPRRLIFPQWTSILNVGKPVFTFISDHWPNHPRASDIFHARSRKDDHGELRDAKLQSLYQTAPSEKDVLKSFRGVLFGSHFLQHSQAGIFETNPNQMVAHWGIDMNRFPYLPFSSDRINTFGFCGRPEKEKGLDLALAAIRNLRTDGQDVRLLVASDLQGSTYGRSILKQVRQDTVLKDHVECLGQIPHAELHRKFYSQVGTLLFPSIWQEPFALTVLEAMASGNLVIGSSTGGTPEIVGEATGYRFDPEKEGDLTQVCRSALAAPAEVNRSKVETAFSRIKESHTLRVMAEKVDGFVRSLL